MDSAWWKIEDADSLPTPAVLIYPDRVNENLDRMIAWTDDPAKLRPHVKTHKLPPIIQMKRAKGITKFKASTIAEVEMVAAAGGEDILLAIQQAGANFRRLLRLIQKYPETRIATVVDDLDHLEWMRGQAAQVGVRVPLYIDLNVGMNRTGISLGDHAMQLFVNLVELSQGACAPIEVGGIHAYDGHLHDPDPSVLKAKAESAFQPVWELCEAISSLGYGLPSVVVSGTPTSPIIAAERRENVEVSAGTTVLWDAGQQRTCPGMKFLNAALVVTRVISRPKANLLCLDLGYKAIASEFPHPRVQLLGLDDATAVTHSEEHLVLETRRASQFHIGSIIYGIPYHICPTVALHSHVWSVRGSRTEACWPVVGRDRIISV